MMHPNQPPSGDGPRDLPDMKSFWQKTEPELVMKWITDVGEGYSLGLVWFVCSCGYTSATEADRDVECHRCHTTAPWGAVYGYYRLHGAVEFAENLKVKLPTGETIMPGRFRVSFGSPQAAAKLEVVLRNGVRRAIPRVAIVYDSQDNILWTPRFNLQNLTHTERARITQGDLVDWATDVGQVNYESCPSLH